MSKEICDRLLAAQRLAKEYGGYIFVFIDQTGDKTSYRGPISLSLCHSDVMLIDKDELKKGDIARVGPVPFEHIVHISVRWCDESGQTDRRCLWRR